LFLKWKPNLRYNVLKPPSDRILASSLSIDAFLHEERHLQ
jgi:hypothetical protein